jgi:hypothetical protein
MAETDAEREAQIYVWLDSDPARQEHYGVLWDDLCLLRRLLAEARAQHAALATLETLTRAAATAFVQGQPIPLPIAAPPAASEGSGG